MSTYSVLGIASDIDGPVAVMYAGGPREARNRAAIAMYLATLNGSMTSGAYAHATKMGASTISLWRFVGFIATRMGEQVAHDTEAAHEIVNTVFKIATAYMSTDKRATALGVASLDDLPTGDDLVYHVQCAWDRINISGEYAKARTRASAPRGLRVPGTDRARLALAHQNLVAISGTGRVPQSFIDMLNAITIERDRLADAWGLVVTADGLVRKKAGAA